MTVSVAAAQQRPHSVLPAHHTTTALSSTPTASSSALVVVAADSAVAECATPVAQQPCTSAAQNAMPNELHVTTTTTTTTSHGGRAGQQRRMSSAWEKGGDGGSSRQPSRRGSNNTINNNDNSSSEGRRPSVSSSVSTHTAQQQQQQPHNNNKLSSSSRRGSNATTTTSNDGAVVIQYALPTIAHPRGSGRQRRGSNTDGSSSRRGSETRRASPRKASIPSTSSTRPAMQHRVSGTWDTLPEQHYEAPGSPIQLRPLRYLKQHGQPTAPMHQSMAPVFRQTLSPADLALLEPGLRNKGGGEREREKEQEECYSLDRNNNHYGQTLDTIPDRPPQRSLQGDTTQYVRPLHDTLHAAATTHYVEEKKKNGGIGSGKASEVQRGVWTGPPMREELRAHTPSSPTPHVSPTRRPSRQQQQDTTTTTTSSSYMSPALVMGGGGVVSEGNVPSQSQSETQRNVQAVEDEAAKIHRAVAALFGRSSETAQQPHYNTGAASAAAHITVTHEGSNGVHLPQLQRQQQQHSQQQSALTPSSHSMSRQPAKTTSSRVEAMPPLLTASNAVAPYSQQQQQQQYGMSSVYKGSEGRLYGHLRGTASASSSGSINSLRDILRREPQHGQTPTHHNTPSSVAHSMQPHERPRSSNSSRCSSHLDDVHHNAQPNGVTTTTSGDVGLGANSSSNGNGNAAPQVEWTPDISPQWIRTPLPRVLAVPEEVPTHTLAALAPHKGKEAAAAAAALPMPHIMPVEEKDAESNATPRPAQRRRPAERNNKGTLGKRQQHEVEDSRTRCAARAGRPPRPPTYKATPAVMNGIMLQRSSGTTKRSITPTQQQKQKMKGNGSTTSHYGGGNSNGNSSGTEMVCVQHMPPLLPIYASHTDAARIMRRANNNNTSNSVEEKTRIAGGGVSNTQGVVSSLPVGSAAARYAQYAASFDVAAHGPRRVSFTRQGGNEGRSSNINTPPAISTMKSAIAAGPVPTSPYHAVQGSMAALPSSSSSPSVANGSNGGAAAAAGTTMLNSSHVRLPLVLRRSSLLSITGPPTTITSAMSTPTIRSSKAVRGHMPGCSPAVLTPVIRGHTPHRIRRPLSFHAPQDEEDGVRLGERPYNNNHHSNGTERDKKRHRQRRVQANLVRRDFSMYAAAASNHHRQQHRSRQGRGVERKALHVLPGHKCAEEARRQQLYGEEDGQRDRYAHLLTQHGFWGESTRCL